MPPTMREQLAKTMRDLERKPAARVAFGAARRLLACPVEARRNGVVWHIRASSHPDLTSHQRSGVNSNRPCLGIRIEAVLGLVLAFAYA